MILICHRQARDNGAISRTAPIKRKTDQQGQSFDHGLMYEPDVEIDGKTHCEIRFEIDHPPVQMRTDTHTANAQGDAP